MYKTINQILPLTTLSKAQVDRNYYRIKDQYMKQGLIYKDEDNTRWIHNSLIPELTTRRRKRKFTKEDINALMNEEWDYFGTYSPEDRVSVEHCHAVMEVIANYLIKTHHGKVKLIYFIENPETNIHVHYLLRVEDYAYLKSSLESRFRAIVSCNTHLEVYDPKLGDQCKDYITKDLLDNTNGWGYHES